MTATVTAVRAAMGLMDCSSEEIARNDVKVRIESKITAVPTAKLLWLILVPEIVVGAVLI